MPTADAHWRLWAAAAVLVVGAAGSAHAAPPAQLVEVAPPPGSTLSPPGEVRVVLDFTRGAAADASTVTVRLDGVAWPGGCTVRSSRDWPPSRVEVGCAVPTGLAPGRHRVELSFRLEGGGIAAHTWELETKRP